MKFNLKTLTYIFVAIFPIMPAYFLTFGFGASNLLAAIYVVIGIVLSGMSIKSMKIKNSTAVVSSLILLWIIIRCITWIWKGNLEDAILTLLGTICVYYVLSITVVTRQIFIKCIEIITYVCGVVCCFGIVEEITHFNIFSLLNTNYEFRYNPLRFGILRILSFSSHTIVYGLYLMFCMSLSLYLLQFINNRIKRNLIRVIYALMWINLLLTLSRSSILAAIISQLFILFLSGHKKFLKSVIKISVIIIWGFIVLSIIMPRAVLIFQNAWYMLLAIFDDSYTSLIFSSFGNDNLNATGNRLDLYRWVAESMKDNWLLGNGNTQFSYGMERSNYKGDTWIVYKTSIEVQYLNTLYKYGIIGLITEVLVYISILRAALLNKLKKDIWEKRIGFNAICFATFLSYFLVFFAVNQSSEKKLFFIFVMLFLLYNNKRKNWGNEILCE